MNKQRTVISIVKEYLNENGYGGLCVEGCGCKADDLAPCGSLPTDCKPGYVHTKDGDLWIVSTSKAPPEDDAEVWGF